MNQIQPPYKNPWNTGPKIQANKGEKANEIATNVPEKALGRNHAAADTAVTQQY